MIFLDWRGFSVHLRKLSGGNVCLAVQKMASSFIIRGRVGITAQSAASYKTPAQLLCAAGLVFVGIMYERLLRGGVSVSGGDQATASTLWAAAVVWLTLW